MTLTGLLALSDPPRADSTQLIAELRELGVRTVMATGDAPALRQAQTGIAVSTAANVAKSAAGIVLTTPGLAGIVATVKVGRMIFQRILTYTLNSITKKKLCTCCSFWPASS